MTTTQSLPHWNMDVVYPGLDSPEFAQGFARTIQEIDALAQLFDTSQIEKRDDLNIDEQIIQTFETVIGRYNAVLATTTTTYVYISCFVSTNSRDEVAQARASELENALVTLSQLETRLTAWLGSLDVERLIAHSTVAHAHAYTLRRAKEQSVHMMTPTEEALAAELNSSAGRAWAKLHSNVTSQLAVNIELDGQQRQVPMSVVRNQASSAQRETRRRAYEAELAAWKETAVPLAAALNSIKGEVNALARRRHWGSALDASLFANSIDRETLDAMMSAARASFPDFRRYMHAKARALQIPQLAWYDIFAPLGTTDRVWDFSEAEQFIVEHFGSFSERLSNFAARAFREGWIDAEPRPGKHDGAYCTPLRADESRIFTNYKPSFDGVSTLAHELGHGYHNFNLGERTELQRVLPMTLAETASIFCETIINQAALKKANREERIAILESSIQGACQVVVDISSRDPNDIDTPFYFRVMAQVQQIPTQTTPTGVLVDAKSYGSIYNIELNKNGGGPFQLSTIWLRTSDNAADLQTIRNVLQSQTAGMSDRRLMVDSLHKEPLYLQVMGILALGPLVALLLILIGNLVASWLSARDRLTNFALLRALGASPRNIASTLTWEQSIIYATAIILGVMFGALLSWMVVPALLFTSAPGQQLTSDEFFFAQNIPPIQIIIPTLLGIGLALLVAICILALGMMVRIVSSPSMAMTLRLNED